MHSDVVGFCLSELASAEMPFPESERQALKVFDCIEQLYALEHVARSNSLEKLISGRKVKLPNLLSRISPGRWMNYLLMVQSKKSHSHTNNKQVTRFTNTRLIKKQKKIKAQTAKQLP